VGFIIGGLEFIMFAGLGVGFERVILTRSHGVAEFERQKREAERARRQRRV
jgi:hypothetical protein